MPLADLLGKRVRTGAGVYVAAPTVRTLFRALEVFGAEIGVVREAARKMPGGIPVDLALAPFLISPEDGRLRYVLDGLWAPGFDAPMVDIAKAAAQLVAPLAGRLDGLLGVPGEEGEPGDDVDSAVLLILGCAERFHIDPMAVMDWPMGLFLDAVRAFSRPDRQESNAQEFVGSVLPTLTTEQAGEAPQQVA